MNMIELEVLKHNLKLTGLQVMCTGDLEVDWRKLEDLQILKDGRNLKLTDDDKIMSLAESLLRFGIVNNLQVWVGEDDTCFCFDAHHRKKAFAVLAEIGLKIPLLPATRCLSATKSDAKRLLLIKESRSSWVNVEVVKDYLTEVNLDFKIAADIIDLPEFKWEDIPQDEEAEEEDNKKADTVPDCPEKTMIKKGDLIELGMFYICPNSGIKVFL